MRKVLETLGSGLLSLFVPRVDADAACGPRKVVNYTSCWQCEDSCGYWAPCTAVCRDGCGCQVTRCHC